MSKKSKSVHFQIGDLVTYLYDTSSAIDLRKTDVNSDNLKVLGLVVENPEKPGFFGNHISILWLKNEKWDSYVGRICQHQVNDITLVQSVDKNN